MYVQTVNGGFVLNPSGSDSDGYYETDNGEIYLYLKNKDNLSKVLKHFFEDASAEWERKVGDTNKYVVKLNGPVKIWDLLCFLTDCPVLEESLIFNVTVPSEQFVNAKKRSSLLKFFVLGSTQQSPNFMKAVEKDFDKTVSSGYVTLRRKS